MVEPSYRLMSGFSLMTQVLADHLRAVSGREAFAAGQFPPFHFPITRRERPLDIELMSFCKIHGSCDPGRSHVRELPRGTGWKQPACSVLVLPPIPTQRRMSPDASHPGVVRHR